MCSALYQITKSKSPVYALKKQKNKLPDTEPRSKDTYASVVSQSEAKVCPQLMKPEQKINEERHEIIPRCLPFGNRLLTYLVESETSRKWRPVSPEAKRRL